MQHRTANSLAVQDQSDIRLFTIPLYWVFRSLAYVKTKPTLLQNLNHVTVVKDPIDWDLSDKYLIPDDKSENDVLTQHGDRVGQLDRLVIA